tara:strand:+ start:2487 stop:2744 length:258 start_codon:yes stop_codon:yes gene_type:complete
MSDLNQESCQYLFHEGYFQYQNEKCGKYPAKSHCERCGNVVCDDHINQPEYFTTKNGEVQATVCIRCRSFIVEYGDLMTKSSLNI